MVRPPPRAPAERRPWWSSRIAFDLRVGKKKSRSQRTDENYEGSHRYLLEGRELALYLGSRASSTRKGPSRRSAIVITLTSQQIWRGNAGRKMLAPGDQFGGERDTGKSEMGPKANVTTKSLNHCDASRGGPRVTRVEDHRNRRGWRFLRAELLARPGRFELPTTGSVDRCSIQLSYGRKKCGAAFLVARPRSARVFWRLLFRKVLCAWGARVGPALVRPLGSRGQRRT